MNYLGHAVFSKGVAGILTGNMIADHVKGQLALRQLPEDVAAGIRLHRLIDAFTDTHPAVARAKLWFRQDYGLYAGAVIDSLLDHFLANDPYYFPNEQALKTFAATCYSDLATYSEWFPERFAGYFPYMQAEDWLFNYRNHKGVRQSLKGLQRRARHMADTERAYALFLAHYYQLGQCYEEFIQATDQYVSTL